MNKVFRPHKSNICHILKKQKFLGLLKSKLMSQYKMKDLGKVKQFLGVSFDNRENDIFIHQSDFTLALLKKFNFENCKAVSTPTDVSTKLGAASSDDKLVDIEKYQSAVGALLYLATRTRPDISFAVGVVSKYCSKPNESNWTAVIPLPQRDHLFRIIL